MWSKCNVSFFLMSTFWKYVQNQMWLHRQNGPFLECVLVVISSFYNLLFRNVTRQNIFGMWWNKMCHLWNVIKLNVLSANEFFLDTQVKRICSFWKIHDLEFDQIEMSSIWNGFLLEYAFFRMQRRQNEIKIYLS